MTSALDRAARRGVVLLVSSLTSLACSMPNPEFDEHDEVGSTAEGDGDGDPNTGDGDGDATTTTTTGDGDPSSGDGDGDGETTTGDGDGETTECAPELTLCGEECVDKEWDQNNCGGCGSICPGGTLCGWGECAPKRYVFVSTHLFYGNFGGSEVANATCTDLAGAAQLPGNYRAWLTDDVQVPVEVFDQGVAAYYVRNGSVVAWSWDDLVDGQLAGLINRNEYGDPIDPSPAEGCQLDYAVWTGTTNTGQASEPLCATWTANQNGALGLVGNAQSSDNWSDSGCAASCGLALPVYCVQVSD